MEGKNNLFNNIMNGIRNNVENSNLGLYYNTSLLPELQDYNRADTVNMSDEEMKNFNVDHIVLDEFHHLGADKWGASVERFLNINSNAKVMGLTATPIRSSDGKDMVEYLFDGEIDSEITLKECFERGILKTPTLINGIYSFEEEIISIENSLKNKNLSKEINLYTSIL